MAAKRDILAHAMRLAACALMLAAAGVARTGAIGGRPVAKPRAGNAAGAVRTGPDGVRVADSSGLEVGVTGYGGRIPVDSAGFREVPAAFYADFPAGIHSMYVGRVVRAFRK